MNTSTSFSRIRFLVFALCSCSFIFMQSCSSKKKEAALLITESNMNIDTLQALAVNALTQYIKKDNRKIAYRKVGSGSPVILCNRFRGTMDDWDPLFIAQLASRYTVITFDYSGIGLSTLPHETDSLTEVKDIKDIAEALHFSKFALTGWSHGGRAAQVFTVRYPEMVSHLILIGTGPLGKNEFASEKVFFDRALKPVNDQPDEVVLFFEPNSATSTAAAKLSHERMAKRTAERDIYVTPDKFQKYLATGALHGSDEAAREKLGTLPIPIMALCGDHDIVFPVENWYKLTRKYSNLQIITLPQSGHGPQHQYPVLSANYMIQFIEHPF